MQRLFGSVALVALLAGGTAQAQVAVKIGVMSDMSSLYSDIGGPGSALAAKMAVEDYGAAQKGLKVEILSADHQNKPDVGAGIVRQWYDVDKVDVIVDVPNSGVALATSEVTREKNKVFLVSGAAASDLTGPKCTPNTIHWTYDTWALAHGTGSAKQHRWRFAVRLGPAKGKHWCSGLGPWMVTTDELTDPYDLVMTARVNGEEWSRGYSGDLHWKFEQMIEFLTEDDTIYPGDIIGSGTVGTGCGLELDKWVQPGDTIELEIEKIGILRNRVVRP